MTSFTFDLPGRLELPTLYEARRLAADVDAFLAAAVPSARRRSQRRALNAARTATATAGAISALGLWQAWRARWVAGIAWNSGMLVALAWYYRLIMRLRRRSA